MVRVLVAGAAGRMGQQMFQLFVRQTRKDPYRACGLVTLLQAEGNRPMSIHWKLVVPLPARLFQAFSVLRDA